MYYSIVLFSKCVFLQLHSPMILMELLNLPCTLLYFYIIIVNKNFKAFVLSLPLRFTPPDQFINLLHVCCIINDV